MPLARHVQGAAFRPEQLVEMTTAFEDVLRRLQLVDRTDPVVDLVAKKVVEVAKSGACDAARICELTLKHLQGSVVRDTAQHG